MKHLLEIPPFRGGLRLTILATLVPIQSGRRLNQSEPAAAELAAEINPLKPTVLP
jgi:hypothetical protein